MQSNEEELKNVRRDAPRQKKYFARNREPEAMWERVSSEPLTL